MGRHYARVRRKIRGRGRSRGHVARIEKNAELHNRHGIPTRILTPDGARDVVPELDSSRFLAAAWNPDDAVVFPWPYVWGYASRAEALGAKVLTSRCALCR